MKPATAASARAFYQVLATGDIAPDCALPDADGNIVNLRSDSISGNPLVLVFCPRTRVSRQGYIAVLFAAARRLRRQGRADFCDHYG